MVAHRHLRGALLLLACTSVSRAQTGAPGADYCSTKPFNEEPPSQDASDVARMHPLNSRARYADAVTEQEWERALKSLRFDARAAFAKAAVDPGQQTAFLAEGRLAYD